MRRVGTLALVSAVAVGAAATAFAALSPKALRASILTAARSQKSVHWVQRNVFGSALLTFTTDAAATEGIQHATLKVGKTTAHLTILVVDQTAYVQGDARALQDLQGLTKAQATQYAGQWISVPKGDQDFSGTAAAVTLPSLVNLLAPHGKLATFSGKLRGKKVIGVRATSGTGKKKELDVLVAPAHGKPLPLEDDIFVPRQASISRMVLSRWNESVTVQAPSSSTPIATVRGGQG